MMTTYLAVFVPLLPLCLPLVVAVCAVVYQDLKARLPERQRAMIDHIAYLAGCQVEQLYADAGSANKKDMAMKIAQSIFAELRLPFPKALTSAAIEAMVCEMNVGRVRDVNPLARGAEHGLGGTP